MEAGLEIVICGIPYMCMRRKLFVEVFFFLRFWKRDKSERTSDYTNLPFLVDEVRCLSREQTCV